MSYKKMFTFKVQGCLNVIGSAAVCQETHFPNVHDPLLGQLANAAEMRLLCCEWTGCAFGEHLVPLAAPRQLSSGTWCCHGRKQKWAASSSCSLLQTKVLCSPKLVVASDTKWLHHALELKGPHSLAAKDYWGPSQLLPAGHSCSKGHQSWCLRLLNAPEYEGEFGVGCTLPKFHSSEFVHGSTGSSRCGKV